MLLLLTTLFKAPDISYRRRRSTQAIVPEGVVCTAMTLTTALVLLCLVGEITSHATPAFVQGSFKLTDDPSNAVHSMKEKHASLPAASYNQLQRTTTIDVDTSDVFITTGLVNDIATPVGASMVHIPLHTSNADSMIFPADIITSRNITITDAGRRSPVRITPYTYDGSTYLQLVPTTTIGLPA